MALMNFRWIAIVMVFAVGMLTFNNKSNLGDVKSQVELREVKQRLAYLEEELRSLRQEAKSSATLRQVQEEDDDNNSGEDETAEEMEEDETEPEVTKEENSNVKKESVSVMAEEEPPKTIQTVSNTQKQSNSVIKDVILWERNHKYDFNWDVDAETLFSYSLRIRKSHYQNTSPPLLEWKRIDRGKIPSVEMRPGIVPEVPMADIQTMIDVLPLNPEGLEPVQEQARKEGIQMEAGHRKVMLKTINKDYSYLFHKKSFSFRTFNKVYKEWVYPQYMAHKYPGMIISFPDDSPPMVYEFKTQQHIDEWVKRSQGLFVQNGQPPKIGEMFVAQKVHMVPMDKSAILGCAVPKGEGFQRGFPVWARKKFAAETTPETVDLAAEQFLANFHKYVDIAVQVWRGESCIRPDFQFFVMNTGKIVHFDIDTCDYSNPEPQVTCKSLAMPSKFCRQNCDEYMGGEVIDFVDRTVRDIVQEIKDGVLTPS